MQKEHQDTTRRIEMLKPGAVDVWVLELDADEALRRDLEDTLSDDEKARAARFHFDRDRHRFIVGRGALRKILAHYLLAQPEMLRFSYSEHGKPSLADISTSLRFNLSHSDQYGILAVTGENEIGADIEKIRYEVETDKLAERFFSLNERRALREMTASERPAAFYRGWACKESLLKAWGTGLSRPLHSFDVELRLEHPAALLATRPDAEEAKRWSLRMIEVSEGFASAIGAQGEIRQVSVKSWAG